MNTPIFPKLDDQLLNEYKKDSDDLNYEEYTGIVLDPEDNIFKTISGTFSDKKDFYEKLSARGYIVRKVFEKKVFDWIKDNAKNTLEAYLMFSTAFSKWKGNNMLNSYYTKLLNDIPQLNRERIKGNPNTRDAGKRESVELEEDEEKISYLQNGGGNNTDGYKAKITLIPIATISKKDLEGNVKKTDQILNNEALFDKYLFTYPRTPINNEKTLGEFLKSNDKFIFDAAQEMLKPKYNEEGQIINGAKQDPKLISDKYPIDKYLIKINDNFVKDKNQNPIEIKKVSFLNWKDNLMTSSGNKANLSNLNTGVRDASITYNLARQASIDNATARMGDKDRYTNIIQATQPKLDTLKQNLNKQRFNNSKWILGVSDQENKPVDLSTQIKVLKLNGIEKDSIEDYKEQIRLDQAKYNDLKQDKSIIANGKKGSKEVEDVYKKYGIDSTTSTSNIDITDTITRKMNDVLSIYNPTSETAYTTDAITSYIKKNMPNDKKSAKSQFDWLTYNLANDDKLKDYLGTDKDTLSKFKQNVLNTAIDDIKNKSIINDTISGISTITPNENKLKKAIDNQELALQKKKDLLDMLSNSTQDMTNLGIIDNTKELEKQINKLEADIEHNKKVLDKMIDKKSSKQEVPESFVNFIKQLKEEYIPIVDDPVCAKYVNYNATQSYINQPTDGVITNPGAIPTSGQYMSEEDQGNEQWGWAHTELNQELFEGTHLKPEVREALLKIAEKFENTLGINLKPVDVYLTGSSANYNYNDASDIDLHLVYDFEQIGINAEILIKYFIAKKQVFNNDYNIKVKGMPVEVGVENLNEPIVASAVYSLTKDGWLLEPGYANRLLPQIDMRYYYELVQKIEDAIETHDSKEIGKVWDELYEIRKKSLADEGEYGKGNAIFKKLRNLGYLNRLKKAYYTNASEELSLESLKEI